ncbi:RING FINGER AND SWIM DOMAIN-CONTAINING PROTEIN 2 [Salix viminalis]|uniref:RING FINGER AND SWIM DOMAIN-CONTAINING PROTEIN 2 n=1 Tax=Salix viminalis TaxID=40686 RepID=A0A9Q0V9F0_SALVM|nr:RING FINGER AND SWIM DOMAIN-CONTAINING PROTEIN 2 [Salix viminalis]
MVTNSLANSNTFSVHVLICSSTDTFLPFLLWNLLAPIVHPHPHHRLTPTTATATVFIYGLSQAGRWQSAFLEPSVNLFTFSIDQKPAFISWVPHGNVYTVTLNATPTCSCPDRTRPCKHILFVLIRVLGVSLDDACLRRRNLRICQLNRLLGTATLPEALAGVCVRERFHQMFFQRRYGVLRPRVEVEDGTTCPICLEEMEKGEKVVACGSCRNTVHEECLMRWKRSKGRRAASCVICRARWRDRNDEDKYLNLAAYAGAG